MNKINFLFYLLTMLAISFVTLGHGTTETTENANQTKHMYRGSSITREELTQVADLSSARDQKGNPVTLEEESYSIGSFTKGTVTIVPKSGKADEVITLDLKPN
ncbi:TPA: hypothetical protein NHI63_002536 [Legionella pneumophila]|uniref:Uncharacterized protein n=2 Tax=Legionella TaxID=445 RepID=A0A378PHW5_9GAMM|nr:MULTISPECIES: hypothetical protein [Legionella]KTD70553.1 hypothetical protein Lstg_3038 [Legionella steigerwaltii]MCZ4692066.1 hypothetical protein [Legionella pneumophila]MCZ4709353.1 hypothetical protein [Legionella pneumophila]MCZ4719585.1 hypothetical protein [Legionella pneumophila]WBA07464.1 hypothetical protein LpnH3D14_03299 [Legionella pneumophila]